jgi:hypothetical protein
MPGLAPRAVKAASSDNASGRQVDFIDPFTRTQALDGCKAATLMDEFQGAS